MPSFLLPAEYPERYPTYPLDTYLRSGNSEEGAMGRFPLALAHTFATK